MCQMIVFDLLCIVGHRFEGWFGSAEDFASQKARKLLACPSCGSAAVERVPSASRVNLGALEPKPPKKPETPAKTPDMEGKDPFAIAQMLYSRMLDELLTKSEDVGKEFPAEARKIFPCRPAGSTSHPLRRRRHGVKAAAGGTQPGLSALHCDHRLRWQ